MFERFTEKARRAIFSARYEASQFGSPVIETEHLLLGLAHQEPAMMSRFASREFSSELLREQIESRTDAREKIATTIDLPLSNECKRVLAYAAEEAERLGHKHIGAEHLLLGLLREEKCRAAEILKDYGVSLKKVRQQIVKSPIVQPGGSRFSALGEPHVRVSLVDEQGAAIEEVPWRAGGFRLPHVGEALEIARDEGVARYRVLDIVWQVTAVAEAPGQMTTATLKLRRENAAAE